MLYLGEAGLSKNDTVVEVIKNLLNMFSYINIELFSHGKINSISRVNRQMRSWNNIFANYITDQELISLIFKQLSQINKNTTNSTEKWKGYKQSTKEEI